MSIYKTLRSLMIKAPFAEKQDLHGKTVIVTGCATGSIGFETAKTLASWGAKVIITTRSQTDRVVKVLRVAAGAQGKVDGHSLDLTIVDSVAEFVAWFEKNHGDRLDILVNNAGAHLDLLSQWKEPHLTADGFEIQWRGNYLGVMHLTHLLLPLLKATGKKTGDARIVFVASKMHTKGYNAGLSGDYPYNSWTAYGMSKLAIVHAAFEIQRRYAETDHLQAYCLHPGSVFTNVADKGLAGNPLIQTVRNALAPVERFGLLTPEEGAQTSVHCATSPNAVGGKYYKQCRPSTACADSADVAAATRLWEKTASWVASLKDVQD